MTARSTPTAEGGGPHAGRCAPIGRARSTEVPPAGLIAGSEKLLLESETLAGQIEQGNNILEAGQFCRLIPRLFLYSIQLGIQRNELQDNLYSLGQMYSEQTRYRQTRLQTVLMPAMIVAVGVFVMFCIMAIFLPMMHVITGLSAM